MNEVDLNERIELHHKSISMIKKELSHFVVGQNDLIEKLLIAIITGGHVLIEGYPGLAKTLTVETLARIMDIDFKRIQFTPDLLPSDLIGSLIFNSEKKEFTPDKGPIFTNFLMADEINRAPAKVQSALLECMQEKKVTIGKTTYSLESPFFVMATQNPIEQEGTFELPEAQKDRFMFKINVTYPSKEEEALILELLSSPQEKIRKLIDKNHLESFRETANKIYCNKKIKNYIIDLVYSSREPACSGLKNIESLIRLGASPRASIYLLNAAKAKAFFEKRAFVIPEDVQHVARNILSHRIILSYEAIAESITTENVVEQMLSKVKVP